MSIYGGIDKNDVLHSETHGCAHTHTVKLCRPKNEGNLPICEKMDGP